MTTLRKAGQLLGLLVATLALALGPGGAARGATTLGPGAAYVAPLSGGEEVPPRATGASGEATFQVSADGQSLTYSVTVRDITNVTMGHIHLGAAGTNGDIVLPLVAMVPPGGGPRSGVIGQGTATAAQLVGPLQGKTMADLVAAMDAGDTYVNIHTGSGASPATLQPGDIPPGELRGQIRPAGAAPAATATRAAPATGGAPPAAGATATRAGAAAPTPAPPTATAAPPPTVLPATGGGYAMRGGILPLATLTALLTLGLAVALRARRRA